MPSRTDCEALYRAAVAERSLVTAMALYDALQEAGAPPVVVEAARRLCALERSFAFSEGWSFGWSDRSHREKFARGCLVREGSGRVAATPTRSKSHEKAVSRSMCLLRRGNRRRRPDRARTVRRLSRLGRDYPVLPRVRRDP